MGKRYFLNFVEEFVMNPAYAADYIGGRVEVTADDSPSGYADDEIRFFTKKQDEFHEFRDLYDFTDVDADGLASIREKISAMFHDEI